jgi:hypothetical protein
MESSFDVMYLDAFIKMENIPLYLVKVNILLVRFTGVTMVLKVLMCMRVEFRILSCTTSLMIAFLIVNVLSAYNVKLDRKTIYEFGAIIFIPYLEMKFPTPMTLGKRVATNKYPETTMSYP